MKRIILLLTLFTLSIYCKAQNADSIYSFINKELPPDEFTRSSWGIFLLDTPFSIDSSICSKIKKENLSQVPKTIQEEFYFKCNALNSEWQNRFHWEQSGIFEQLIVKDSKHKVIEATASKLNVTKLKRQEALKWIKEWNKTGIHERLVNYLSIPVFSADGNYVLIVRGQYISGRQGWDTIYIYKKEKNGWVVCDRIIVTQI